MTGILNIGITGMRAAQIGLMTAEHNITNATTPGYSRQRSVQSTNIALQTGAGFIGQGVNVSTVERIYGEFLVAQTNQAQTSVSQLDTYYSQIKQIDNMLADPSAGLSPALQDFFRAAQEVASNPSLLPSRQSMLSAGEAMMSRFHNIESRLGQMYEAVNGQISSTVATINSYATQIAALNGQITLSQAAAGQPANDMLDQRDNLITELNKLVKVSVAQEGDGAYNVFIGNGQQLVVGKQTATIAATASNEDPSRIIVGLKTAGIIQQLPENLITGGSLGGFLAFRSESLDRAANELGRVASSLALTFNAQHGLGQDMLGNIAGDVNFVGDVFKISGPKVLANSLNAAGGATVTASFTSPPPFSGNFYTDLTPSDYRLTSDGANLTLTRLNDNKQWSGANIAAINGQIGDPPAATDPQGFSLSSAGAFAAGASYLIQPTREVARNISIDKRLSSDPRLLAAAAPMRVVPGGSNAGDAKMTNGVAAAGYSTANLPATLNFTGVGPSYFGGLPGGATVNLNGAVYSINFDGMDFELTGTPQVGDTFSVQRNTSGVGDSRNAVLLGKLQTQNTVAGGNATYQSTYAKLVSDNGNKTREVQVTLEAQKTLLQQSQQSREALSGVNLDEEAANLLRFQTAYQASAKMIEIGNRLFEVLLAIR